MPRCGIGCGPAPSASAVGVPQGVPRRPRRGWAVDFPFDAGRPIKICSIVDEHTRECLGGIVDRSITAEKVTAHLEGAAAERGPPMVLRSDNGYLAPAAYDQHCKHRLDTDDSHSDWA